MESFTPNQLKRMVTDLVEEAKRAHAAQTEDGPSSEGRILAIIATESEKLQALIGYNGV